MTASKVGRDLGIRRRVAVAALESERENLKGEYAESLFEGDISEQRRITAKRAEIGEEHKGRLQSLREDLASLTDDDRASAELAARVDMFNLPGDAFIFGSRLRDVLVSNHRELKARQSAVKRELPKYSQDIYSEVRAELDEEYAAKQERGGMSEVEYENFQKRKAEQERKNEAANTPFVGVGAHGGPRRSKPSEQDFSS